jgi:DNA polymerase III subunit epsilon
MDKLELEQLAIKLGESPDFKVLRRLERRVLHGIPINSEMRSALFLDVETTGLDPTNDEIIQLAMVRFTYSLDGKICDVSEPFDRLRQPSKPIPPEITALTGLTDASVLGRQIDQDEVSAFAAKADLVIAHNAAFDRQFIEKLFPLFVLKPWACSMDDVDWRDEGFESTKLAYLAMEFGFFYDRHNAVDDCLAAIEILDQSLPKSGKLALSNLLANARKPSWRIWAENSPYETKDILKARGYRWVNDPIKQSKGWYIDISEGDRINEEQFLKTEIYRHDVSLKSVRLTAYNRYSDRIQ